MIYAFACPDTERLFHSQVVPGFRNIERIARRQLLQLQAATELASLRIPPGNRLEALKGDRQGQHSIRVDNQWRICFLNMGLRFWLNLQSEYDMRMTMRELQGKIAPRVRTFQPEAA